MGVGTEKGERILAVNETVPSCPWDVLGCEVRAGILVWSRKCSQDRLWAPTHLSFSSFKSEACVIPPHSGWVMLCQLLVKSSPLKVLSSDLWNDLHVDSSLFYLTSVSSCSSTQTSVPMLAQLSLLHLYPSQSTFLPVLLASSPSLKSNSYLSLEIPLSMAPVPACLSKLNSETLSKPVCFLRIFPIVLTAYNLTWLRTPTELLILHLQR